MSVPKLEDVAARAGVSPATVSRFLNKPEVVAKATGERIQAAIVETGYIPNLMAGGLASSKSRLVAVLIPYISNSIFDATIEAMVEELSAGDTNVMLGLTGVDPARTDKLIRAALSRRVDAIITTGEMTAEHQALLRASKTTVLQIWDFPADPIDIAIGFSHVDLGRDIARFLHTRGYRRPHVITAAGSRARLRRDGIVSEWKALGGEGMTEGTVPIPSRFGYARGAFADMRRLDERPDVAVCGSDFLAMGLIVEAQAAGLKVPEDLAIMGFGNSSNAGEMRPTITSVDIDGSRIAREAISVIRRRLKGEDVPERRIDVGFRLIARESA
ncbi:LacI family DNA-binding transcriptional regulator [Sphingomonas sp. AOB5]|uniref:LacI family DNA-binding transcriptional regulator n=1 Tax=Sphingomonas sp. AOB5 TaxID=3034017 RepID=UPI0023F748CC|nr:LacI family DNA-binding transcriptional regulator [Sphingomonas sp. AOB5]MDF7776362.1 LacI family DNA-binding transcriptional regulator [Sphingomonas sp. AOB5]